MIELILKKYLDEQLDVPSFFERPIKPPQKYILIEKTGGSKSNQVNGATVAFQSYAPSLFDAASLNEELKTALENSIYHTELSKAKLNSDYNFTDPETKEYRYQALFDFIY